MGSQQKHPESFVLVYEDDGDPTPEETSATLEFLKPFEAEEVVPGTIRVTGEPTSIAAKAGDLEHWQLSKEKQFELNPPHKSKYKF